MYHCCRFSVNNPEYACDWRSVRLQDWNQIGRVFSLYAAWRTPCLTFSTFHRKTEGCDSVKISFNIKIEISIENQIESKREKLRKSSFRRDMLKLTWKGNLERPILRVIMMKIELKSRKFEALQHFWAFSGTSDSTRISIHGSQHKRHR